MIHLILIHPNFVLHRRIKNPWRDLNSFIHNHRLIYINKQLWKLKHPNGGNSFTYTFER